MVSLVDSTRQYVLAESTRTLSLSDESAEDGDEIWLGHAIIAKGDAVRHHTFRSTYTAKEKHGEPYVAEALVIPDCAEDERVSHMDFVKSEPGVRFYAGVPIITKMGFRIGVLAISDNEPRHEMKATDIRFMEDMAATVMEHLELAKDRDDANKGARMVRVLTEFIERFSLHEACSTPNFRLTLERQTENVRLQAVGEDEPAEAIPASTCQPQQKLESSRESGTFRIYQRAARIIRQSTDADGVVFFDTSATRITIDAANSSLAASSDESTYSSPTASSTIASRSRRREKVRIYQVQQAGPLMTGNVSQILQ